MGLYINPEGETKEEFLEREGTKCTRLMRPSQSAVWVCLVDNTEFTAALVICSDADIRAVMNPDDNRPKKFYRLHRSQLSLVCGEERFNYLPCQRVFEEYAPL